MMRAERTKGPKGLPQHIPDVLNFYVVLAPLAKFGLHAGDMKLKCIE